MSAFRLRRRDRTGSAGDSAGASTSEAVAAADGLAGPDAADSAGPQSAADAGSGHDGVPDAGGEGDVGEGDVGEGDVGEGEWLAYEFHEWALEARVMLQQLLTLDQIVHSWQGTTLVVHESLEEKVDGLVEEVEEAQEAATGAIGEDEELTAYEIGDWPSEVRAELVRRLLEARIPHMIDESGASGSRACEIDATADAAGSGAGEPGAAGAPQDSSDGDGAPQDDEPGAAESASPCDLLVREVDEQRVELVIDDLLAQVEDSGLEELEGLDANDLLGSLFVACDRLRREPRDVEGAGALAAAGERLSAVRAPFGFSASNWRSLQHSVGALLDLIADPESDPEDVRDAAGRMSGSLKSLI